MKKIFLILSFFILCERGFAQVTIADSFMHGGIMRTYRLYVPAIYNASNAVPVVLNLHGYTSNGMQQELYGDFRPIADTANFIIAHPDGTFDANNFRFWNTFGLSPVDDIGFISSLLDTIIARYNVNQQRIYSTGMSNGGYMSHLLACSLGNRITAVASVTGTMTMSMRVNCSPFHPTPAMQIHGTADAVVPYAGSGVSLHIDTVVKHWVDFNNCNATPVYTAVPDIVPADGCTAEHYLYNGGDNGATVELYKIIGGGHTWPGAPIMAGVTNMDIIASKEIWRFFSQYSLNNLATGTNNIFQNEYNHITIFPNPASAKVTITFESVNEKKLTLFTSVGQKIFETVSKESEIKVTIPPGGIYFLQVKEKNNISMHKIVAEQP